MTIRDMAHKIMEHYGKLQYAWDHKLVLYIHVRTQLYMYTRITDEHILECCEKAGSYEVFMTLCSLFGKADEKEFKKRRKVKLIRSISSRDSILNPTQLSLMIDAPYAKSLSLRGEGQGL